MSSRSVSLFLSDLPEHWTEATLQIVFAAYNGILSFRVRKLHFDMPISFGLVEFSDVASAYHALKHLNGKTYNNFELKLTWAYPAYPLVPSNSVAQLMVSFKTKVAMNAEVDTVALDLRKWFSIFGVVRSVSVQKLEHNTKYQQHGFAFVSYSMSWDGMVSATKAAEYFSKITVGAFQVDARFTAEYTRFLNQYGLHQQQQPIRQTSNSPPSVAIYHHSGFEQEKPPLHHRALATRMDIPFASNLCASEYSRQTYYSLKPF